ncbi:MAG: hypothetical protein DRJ03_01610 [Chloroflexi bacterium]|nr:MAG: hypothetical protein DRJ03_01610 [Chloroflexota bacterium]
MINLKPIEPKEFKIPGIKGKLEKMLRHEAWIQRRMMQKVTRTWKGTKPRFKREIKVDRGNLRLTTLPYGNPKAVNKFRWLNEGTRVRHAVMSKDFRPKTRHRTIGSRRGRGGMVFVSRKIRQPGIKAREWTDEIRKRRTPKFRVKVERTFAVITKDITK